MCLVEMENLGGRGSPDIRQWEEVVVLIHLTLQNKRTVGVASGLRGGKETALEVTGGTERAITCKIRLTWDPDLRIRPSFCHILVWPL